MKLYCAELGCGDFLAMKDFDKKLCLLICYVETSEAPLREEKVTGISA